MLYSITVSSDDADLIEYAESVAKRIFSLEVTQCHYNGVVFTFFIPPTLHTNEEEDDELRSSFVTWLDDQSVYEFCHMSFGSDTIPLYRKLPRRRRKLLKWMKWFTRIHDELEYVGYDTLEINQIIYQYNKFTTTLMVGAETINKNWDDFKKWIDEAGSQLESSKKTLW